MNYDFAFNVTSEYGRMQKEKASEKYSHIYERHPGKYFGQNQ